ncbi:MAG: hypothetical protein [Bacteriophage sp.]|nr:MAG: hypothetical protein [Bacteriophage sp.]
MAAEVRYTSYKCVFLLYHDSAKVYATLQCPIDRLDAFLEELMGMKWKDAFFCEVHGTRPDGSVDVIRGDISRIEPRGSCSIRHTTIISPGTTIAKKLAEASAEYIRIETERRELAAKKAAARPKVPGAPATPSGSNVVSLADAKKALQDKREAAAVVAAPINYDFFPEVKGIHYSVEDFK